MNRIRERLNQLREANKKALVCFVTAGFPDLKTTEKIVNILQSCGVDIIELGVPFSDPIADGPIIQWTSFKALENKISLRKILQFVKKNRPKIQIPIVIMSYLNPIYRYGLKRFFLDAKISDVDGIIIPDLIPEEGKIVRRLSYKYKLPIIYLLSITSGENRQEMILTKSQEFVYVVSVTGVTGPREKFSGDITSFLKKLKRNANIPLLLGFGISNTKQVEKIKKYVDGIVIGSALLKVIDKSKPSELCKNITDFLFPFREVLDKQ